jgi:hypothetical protein
MVGTANMREGHDRPSAVINGHVAGMQAPCWKESLRALSHFNLSVVMDCCPQADMADLIQRVYKTRMARLAPIAIARSVAFVLASVPGATDAATSYAQARHGEVSTEGTRQSQVEQFGTEQGPRAGASKSLRKEPSATDDPTLPGFQLILPEVPLCWSHARAENPQGNQNNGELVEERERGVPHSNVSPDPLLGPFAPTSAAGNVDHHEPSRAKR